MPRLKDWTQEYPGGPWRAQCGGYLLEASEAGRSLADLAAAGVDGPSWAVRRAGLGTIGDPTAGQVAGGIADTLEAAQDMAELEVMGLLANDANVRALLVGMWRSPEQVERQNVQTLGIMESVDALKARAEAAEAQLRATPIESSILALEVDDLNKAGVVIDGLHAIRKHMKPVNPGAVIIVLPPGVRMIDLDQSQAVTVAFSAIADALGVPERERPVGVLTAVQRAQYEWRGAREALAEARAALHDREAECEALKATARNAICDTLEWIPVVDGQIPPGRWLIWDAVLKRTYFALPVKGAIFTGRITHYCAAPTGPGGAS